MDKKSQALTLDEKCVLSLLLYEKSWFGVTVSVNLFGTY